MRDLDDDRVSQLLYAVYCAIAIIIILCSGYITLRLDNRLLRPVNIIMMWLHVTQRYKGRRQDEQLQPEPDPYWRAARTIGPRQWLFVGQLISVEANWGVRKTGNRAETVESVGHVFCISSLFFCPDPELHVPVSRFGFSQLRFHEAPPVGCRNKPYHVYQGQHAVLTNRCPARHQRKPEFARVSDVQPVEQWRPWIIQHEDGQCCVGYCSLQVFVCRFSRQRSLPLSPILGWKAGSARV